MVLRAPSPSLPATATRIERRDFCEQFGHSWSLYYRQNHKYIAVPHGSVLCANCARWEASSEPDSFALFDLIKRVNDDRRHRADARRNLSLREFLAAAS